MKHNKRMPVTTQSAVLFMLWALTAVAFAVDKPQQPMMNIADTVIMMPLEEEVGMDDAVESMKLRANTLNFKLVAHQPLYKELQAMGLESKRIEIFQFCDARIAQIMIKFNKNFAAYLPCRIVLLEDEDGKPWLITMNLDIMIQSAGLTPELMEKANIVKDSIASIMQAGASGDL